MMKRRYFYICIAIIAMGLIASCTADRSHEPSETDEYAAETTAELIEAEADEPPTETVQEILPSEKHIAPAVMPPVTDMPAVSIDVHKIPHTDNYITMSTFDGLKLRFDNFPDYILELVASLLDRDTEAFARHCGVPAEVYAGLESLVFGEVKLMYIDIPAANDPTQVRSFPAMELPVVESGVDFLPVGTHRIILDEGLYLVFHILSDDGYTWYSDYIGETRTPAEIYVDQVCSDVDFEPISAENKRQFGLSEFIILRLSEMNGISYGEFTADEIKSYSEKYLGVDGDTLRIEETLFNNDGKYQIIGHGSASFVRDFVSTEKRGDTTVVTVQFWADYARTVKSRLVEFHMTELDGEFVPLKTVVLEDSGLKTAVISC
nr:hypothetical protein [Clostridia bacterium]